MSSLELQFTDSRILEPRILDVLASDWSASTACASSVSSIYSCRTPLAVSSNYIQDCLSILHAKIFLQGNCLIHAWKVLTDWSRASQLDDLIFRCNDNESTDYYSLDQSVQNTTGLQHPRKSKNLHKENCSPAMTFVPQMPLLWNRHLCMSTFSVSSFLRPAALQDFFCNLVKFWITAT
jgi:hypothetical protein